MMRCGSFEKRLQAQLDARRSPQRDARLQAHAARCARCDALLAAHTALRDGVVAWRPPAPSSDLTRRVLAQWKTPGQAADARPRRRAQRSANLLRCALLTGAAAVLWLLVAPAILRDDAPLGLPGPPAQPLAMHSGGAVRSDVEPPAALTDRSPQVASPQADSPQAITAAELALLRLPTLPWPVNRLSADFSDVVGTELPDASGAVAAWQLGERMARGVSQLSAAAAGPGWGEGGSLLPQQVAYGLEPLRPLRTTLSAAWAAIWRTLPAAELEEDPETG